MRIDLVAECFWRDGQRSTVRPKAFLVLRRLMDRPEQVVTKGELLDAVWPDTFVTETILNVAIRELRQALGDDTRNPTFIATVHGRGFRWIGPPASSSANGLDDDSGGFVGRAQTLAELQRCYAAAAAGRRQVVFLTGEPGIGKTAIVDHFVSSLVPQRTAGADKVGTARALAGVGRRDRTDVLLACGQCTDRYGVGDTFRPLLDAAESLLRGDNGGALPLFRKHAPTWLLQMPDLLSAAEIKVLHDSVKDSTVERMQREIERALEALSVDHTVVLVLEDLHWGDKATIGLIGALAARRGPARLLILGTYRPFDAIANQHPVVALKHELAGKRQCVELALDGLSSEAVRSYIDRRFGDHRLPPALASRLHAQTSGNPLFLLNAVADLVQRGWFYQRDGKWECGVDIDAVAKEVPDGTRALIAFRLDQLTPATQELLEAASLAGMSFTTQAVAAALERSASDVEEECRRLTRTLFLQEGEAVEWPDGSDGRLQRFRHSLYRQVLEERVSPTRRQLLHRRIAERMLQGFGDRASEIAAPLRYHFEQSKDVFRAVDFIEIMAHQTFARRALHEAIALYDHAAALLQRLPESPARQRRLLQMNIAVGLLSTTTVGGSSAQAVAAIEQVQALSVSPSQSAEQILSMVTVAGGHIGAGRYREGGLIGQEIMALAGKDAPPDVMLNGNAMAGMASYYIGDVEVALLHLERAAAIATVHPPLGIGDGPLLSVYDTGVPALATLAQALTLSGRAQRGAMAVEATLARARKIEMPWYVGYSLSGACAIAVFRRDLRELRRRASELQTHCGDGQEHLQAVARFMLHWAAVIETRDPAKMGPLREALDEVATIPNPLVVHRNFSILADAHLALGEADEASTALDRAIDERGEGRYYDAQLCRQRAAILLVRRKRKSGTRDSSPKQAETLLEEAIEVAARQGTRLLGLRATVDLCRLWAGTDRASQARSRLTDALAASSEGISASIEDVDMQEARELLRAL